MGTLQPTRRRVPSVFALILSTCLFAPAFAVVVECGEEHYVSGTHRLPTHEEAMATCREHETAMTETGAWKSVRSCYDVAPPGEHGPWMHGRIGVDVVARTGGDPMTFEALWMCKPTAEREMDGPAFE